MLFAFGVSSFVLACGDDDDSSETGDENDGSGDDGGDDNSNDDGGNDMGNGDDNPGGNNDSGDDGMSGGDDGSGDDGSETGGSEGDEGEESGYNPDELCGFDISASNQCRDEYCDKNPQGAICNDFGPGDEGGEAEVDCTANGVSYCSGKCTNETFVCDTATGRMTADAGLDYSDCYNACYDASAVAECANDGECPADEECINGKCEIKEMPGDENCAEGQTCADNVVPGWAACMEGQNLPANSTTCDNNTGEGCGAKQMPVMAQGQDGSQQCVCLQLCKAGAGAAPENCGSDTCTDMTDQIGLFLCMGADGNPPASAGTCDNSTGEGCEGGEMPVTAQGQDGSQQCLCLKGC